DPWQRALPTNLTTEELVRFTLTRGNGSKARMAPGIQRCQRGTLKHMTTQALEHGSSRSGRWLRERRLRVTLWIAAVEGLLYLVHVLHWWEAVVMAAIGVGIWWTGGRNSPIPPFWQASVGFGSFELLVLWVPV